MEDKKKILERFYKLREEKKEFYERYPKLLEQLNVKIKALEEDNYEIIDACWIISYVGCLIVNEQIMTRKEETLKERKGKQDFSIEQAKSIMKEFKTFENFKNK